MPDDTTIRHEPHVRPFSEVLPIVDSGNLDAQITAALAEVASDVGRLEKPGVVTIKLTLEPAGSGGRSVTLAGEVTAKPPKAAPPAGFFWLDAAGGFHREDPYQMRLDPARPLDTDTDTPRTLDD